MTQRHREDFIARLARAGVRPDDARKLLRYARTLHRLAEAQCNGDWPARDPAFCPECDGQTYTGSIGFDAKRCERCDGRGMTNAADRKSWSTERSVRQICTRLGIEPEFSGDPRGCVLKLRVPGDPGELVGVP